MNILFYLLFQMLKISVILRLIMTRTPRMIMTLSATFDLY